MTYMGIVKWYDEHNGYGFIDHQNGHDVYVHFSAVKRDNFKELKEGQKVRFEIVPGELGVAAANVEILN